VALKLLYFAGIRDAIGRDEEIVDPPPEVTTVAALVEWLVARGEVYRTAFADRARLRAAVDQSFAKPEASIAGAHEIALFPPVTGG